MDFFFQSYGRIEKQIPWMMEKYNLHSLSFDLVLFSSIDDIKTPETLFKFVNAFYTATLLYYRTFPLLHFPVETPVNEETTIGMKLGLERLSILETRFINIVNTLEPTFNSDFILEWNKRTEKEYKKLPELRWEKKRKINYSTKACTFFRNELIARLNFYKRLRDELAQALSKNIRDFPQLHALFVRYYGSMRFFDMYHFGKGLHEGEVGMLFEPECREYLEELIENCRYDERRAKKIERYHFPFTNSTTRQAKESSEIVCAFLIAQLNQYLSHIAHDYIFLVKRENI